MNRKLLTFAAGAAAIALLSIGGGEADAAAKKICYAFQDLSTGFWGAGHAAIVGTLTKNGV